MARGAHREESMRKSWPVEGSQIRKQSALDVQMSRLRGGHVDLLAIASLGTANISTRLCSSEPHIQPLCGFSIFKRKPEYSSPCCLACFCSLRPSAVSLLGPCAHSGSSGAPSLSALPSSAFGVLSTGQGLHLSPGPVLESSWTPASNLFWAQGRSKKWKLHVPYV